MPNRTGFDIITTMGIEKIEDKYGQTTNSFDDYAG